MKNYYFLDFKDQFIKDDIEIVNDRPDVWQTSSVSVKEFVTPSGLNFLKKIRIFPNQLVNFFIGPPNSSTDIHIDTPSHPGPHSYAINYVWAKSGTSKMKWFKSTAPGQKNYTTSNLLFHSFSINEVELIEEIEVPVKTLMLVRIDVPHLVENYSVDKRYCLSIRGLPYLEWEDISKYLSSYILAED